jgi:hypothetical protein
MSVLGLFNFVVVQWFFIRLAKVLWPDGKITWKIIGPILPLTGWWSDYIYLKKRKRAQAKEV